MVVGSLFPTGTPPVLFLAVDFRLGASSRSDSVNSGEALRFCVFFNGAISSYENKGCRVEKKSKFGRLECEEKEWEKMEQEYLTERRG